MEEKRVATEISGLDEVLHGRASLLAGAAGTGKTILSLPWLLKVAPGRGAGGGRVSLWRWSSPSSPATGPGSGMESFRD